MNSKRYQKILREIIIIIHKSSQYITSFEDIFRKSCTSYSLDDVLYSTYCVHAILPSRWRWRVWYLCDIAKTRVPVGLISADTYAEFQRQWNDLGLRGPMISNPITNWTAVTRYPVRTPALVIGLI